MPYREYIPGLMVLPGKSGQFTRREDRMGKRPSIGDFLTNLDQPMPFLEKKGKLIRNLWRRIALRQNCCGHPGEPGC
jgi:hypothetical protein